MLKFLLKMFLLFLAVCVMVSIHIGCSYLLPYPYSSLNVLFLIILFLLFTRQSGLLIWLTFLSHFFVELYTTAPFGVMLYSATMSVLLSYWLYRDVLTSRSFLASVLLSGLSLIIYRCLYVILLFISTQVTEDQVPWGFLFISFGWELLFTVCAVALFYAIFLMFWKKKNPFSFQTNQVLQKKQLWQM